MQQRRIRFVLTIGAISMVLLATVALIVPSTATAQTVVTESPLVPQDQIPSLIRAAVHAADRPAADKGLDAGRLPEQLLTFCGIRPGMNVADLWAGGGYSTELLARIVGTTGAVYSQNPPFPPEFQHIGQAWTERLKSPTLKNVVAVSRSFDATDVLPVPPGSLDVVVMNMNYHDLVLQEIDRTKVNATVYQALKSGGAFALVDHSAKDGSGIADIQLHRIDEQFVITEVRRSGFILAARSSALRNPTDDRTWVASPRGAGERRGTTDRFMLLFRKP